MLAGKVQTEVLDKDDIRGSFPRFSEDHVANARLVAVIGELAREKDVTAAQVALACVQSRADAHGLTVVPIPGTRRPSRLDENLDAVFLQLGSSELATLNELGGQVRGIRLV